MKHFENIVPTDTTKDIIQYQTNWHYRYSWVSENMGPRGERWTARDGEFHFRDAEDMTLFLLVCYGNR